jgi:hypothetical protein
LEILLLDYEVKDMDMEMKLPMDITLFEEFLDQNPAAKQLSRQIDKLVSPERVGPLGYLAYAFQIWNMERTIRDEADANRRMTDNMLKLLGDRGLM